MKNSKFVAIIIAIVAPIVKKFPTWAVKYTKNTNPYAEEFQLSTEDEKKYLLKHPHSAEWIGLRRWHLQTRKYFFKNEHAHPEIFKAFMHYINNNIVYDAAYEIVPEEAIKAKSYTLDASRVIKACNDNINCLYILAEKQPQTFSVSIVRELHNDVTEAYFSYLLTKCRWEKLMELDVVLFEEAAKSKVAEKCLSFLMGLKDYNPNLSAEQLVTLGDKFEKWCNTADALIVIKHMTEYWQEHKDFQHILNLLKRLANAEESQKRNDVARSLLKILPSDLCEEGIYLLLENGIACPSAFKFLLDKKDEIYINYNLTLCISQKMAGKVPISAFNCFSIKQKRTLLVALANDGILSKEMLNKAPDETTKNELLDILEEKAQEKWFKPLINCFICEDDIKTLARYRVKGKIHGALQDLTFQDKNWVSVFIEKGWYDEKHLIRLMQSPFIAEIQLFIMTQKMSQTLYEALLTGCNAHLAPEAMLKLEVPEPKQNKELI